MNKDQVEGRVEQAKGHVKDAVGNVTGNRQMESEGEAQQVTGKTQAGYGDAKENVKDTAKDVINKI